MEHIIKTKAKINISLDILRKREDGYHDLRMIMHSVNLCDTLVFKPNNETRITLSSNNRYLPCDNKNIVFKAYDLFYKSKDIKQVGFNVKIIKNIPICAGLGGGSSNAAETLKFLNNYHGNPYSDNELIELGKSLGADVPYCIMGGTCLAEGIGEKLVRLKDLPSCFIVITKPRNKGLSTRRIFSKVNVSKIKYHPDTQGIINALNNGDLNAVCQRLYNVLEEYSISECGEISVLKSILIENGALGALMSGSGNAVYGIFDDKDKANNAYDKLKELTNLTFLV